MNPLQKKRYLAVKVIVTENIYVKLHTFTFPLEKLVKVCFFHINVTYIYNITLMNIR